jgi:hypothetical protein
LNLIHQRNISNDQKLEMAKLKIEQDKKEKLELELKKLQKDNCNQLIKKKTMVM